MGFEMALLESEITIKEEFDFVEVPEDHLSESKTEIESEHEIQPSSCSNENVNSASDHTYATKKQVLERTRREKRKEYGRRYCCVVNCHNREGRPSKDTGEKLIFYQFSKTYQDQTKLWVKALNELIASNEVWQPKPNSRICSAHFLGNKKSVDPESPSYMPTIFPNDHRKRPTEADLARYKRRVERRIQRERIISGKKTKKIETTKTVPQWEDNIQFVSDIEENLLKAQSEVIAQPKPEELPKFVRAESPFKIMLEYGTQTPKYWLKELVRGNMIPAMTNQATQTDQMEIVSTATMTQ